MHKRLLTIFVVLLLAFSFGCQKSAEDTTAAASPEELSGKIVVWSFTDEVGTMIPNFNEKYPNIEVEYVVIPDQDAVFLNKVITTMKSRSAVPDVFTGEAAFFKQFIESGFWEPLSDAPYNAEDLVKDMTPYVVGLSRNSDGKITCLSWQATPGAMYYRRSIAKDVLGTDDPATVSSYTSDMSKYYELGEMIKEKYNGERFLVAGYQDMSQFIYQQRTEPYVIDGTLTIPYSLVEYMKLAKDMRDNGIEGGVGTWSPAWFTSMADASVFSYILPTWGLHYVLKPNAEPEAHAGNAEYSGDWGVCVPPAAYNWGGTFVGISRFSEHKDLAWAFVKHIGYDPEFMEWWAKETGDFVGNLKVVDKIKGDFSDPFLGGQNHYEYFYNEVQKIDPSRIGPWDQQIQNAWDDQVQSYANGDKSLDEAMADFKVAIADVLPNAEVVIKTSK